MPGPGKKKSPKHRGSEGSEAKTPSLAVSTLPDTEDVWADQIASTESWTKIVNILCKKFQLPDLTTRSGLKRVHADFDSIYKRLDDGRVKYSKNEKLVGGIIGIYAKLCMDSLLRDLLWKRGLLEKILPLLDSDSARHVALQSLAVATHHGGVDIRLQIAVHSNKLANLVERFQDDETLADLVICSLSHSLAAVFDRDINLPAHIVTKLDMSTIYKVVTDTMRKTWASSNIIIHGILLLSLSSVHAPEAFKRCVPAQRILIAGLRCNDWVTRCTCIRGLIRLHRNEAEDEMSRILDPNRLMNRARMGFPPHLQKAMEDFGMDRCTTFITLHTASEYQKAIFKATEDKDLCEFGLKVADFIPKTEFCVFEGVMYDGDPRKGGRKREHVFPFQSWTESPLHAARSLRLRGKAEDEDKIYLLSIKHAIQTRQIDYAVALAHDAMEKYPDVAYFYYAVSLSGDDQEALKGAKKGLKLKTMTPFVRTQLLQRAAGTAAQLGIETLHDCSALGMSRWGEGVALLTSALEDARAFLEMASPDNRNRNVVAYWYILLTILVKGPGMSLDLSEAKFGFDAQKMADDFFESVLINPPKSDLRLTQESLVKLYQSSWTEYGGIIQKLDLVQEPKVNLKTAADDLATWLEDTHIHGEYPDPDMHIMASSFSSKLVELYRCSHCGNPSAVLRKCSGCTQARYCDAKCQKAHWKDHKKACQKINAPK